MLNEILRSADMEAGIDNKSHPDIMSMPWNELQNQSYSNLEVRNWYVYQCEHIPDDIPADLSMEDKARIAFERRNEIKHKARDIMADTKARKKLDEKRGVLDFDSLVQRKMAKKGMAYAEAVADILKTATTTNKEVNKFFNIKED